MAQMVESAVQRVNDALESIRATGQALSTSKAEDRSLSLRQDSESAACSEPSHLRNRMREIRTYGSVGAGGGQPPSATRRSTGDPLWIDA